MEDGEALTAWLVEHVLPHDQHPDHLHEPDPGALPGLAHRTAHAGADRPLGAIGTAHLRERASVPPRASACRRRSASAWKRCCCPNRPRQVDPREPPEPGWAVLTGLLADPGPANLESLLEEVAKLDRVRALGLPPDLFDGISPKVLQTYRQSPRRGSGLRTAAARDAAAADAAGRLRPSARARTHGHLGGSAAEHGPPHRRPGRTARRAGTAGGPEARRRQERPAVPAGRGRLGAARRHRQGRGLPGRQRADAARPGQGMEGQRSGLPQARADGHPQLLPLPLPPHGAAPAACPGLPLQQRRRTSRSSTPWRC